MLVFALFAKYEVVTSGFGKFVSKLLLHMLKAYLRKIFEVTKRGDAREESYYSSLEELFKTFADSINKKQIHITTLPKKTDAGNPDFRIWDGKQNIVGYIEAKDQQKRIFAI